MENIKIPDLSQATNLQDSDLLVLEQGTGTNKIDLGGLFNTNRGFQIDSDGISNVFADLSSIDVNTVQYNYQGYVANCTNLPTGYTHGQLICITGTGTGAECEQIYSPWNENSIYIRAYYGSAWTDWQKLTAEFDLPASTDLNTVTYNFRGYAPTPTNAPTSGSFNLDVVCRKDGLSGQQIASKYNDTVVYVRTWYTSSGTRRWNSWRQLSDCYMPGDNYSRVRTRDGYLMVAGHFVSATSCLFSIPMSKPILAYSVTFNNLCVAAARGISGANYFANTDIANTSGYTISANVSENAINVALQTPSQTGTARTALIFALADINATFS